MNIEYIVNDHNNPIEIPLHEGTYKFPELKDGEFVSFVNDADGGQETFDRHREKFLKNILARIVHRKPKVQDYIKFDVHSLNGKEVVFYDRIAWGEISYKLLRRSPLSCEYLFTPYPPDDRQLDLFKPLIPKP
jgi:hypothetical protein